MENRILEKDEWADELIKLWRLMDGEDIMIEVEALKLGDQVEAEFMPLKGLSYDHKDDVVQVWVGPLEHMISKPVKIELAVEKDRLLAIDITDADGEQHLIKPQEAIML